MVEVVQCFLVQVVVGVFYQWCVVEFYVCQVIVVVGQLFYGGQVVWYIVVCQFLCVVCMFGFMLLEQCFCLWVMYCLMFIGQLVFFIIFVMYCYLVFFVDMVDVCQLVMFVILLLFCGFIFYGVVCEVVCFVIVLVGDQIFIFVVDKFVGQVVVIMLCVVVKVGFLYQLVKYIVMEGGVVVVFIGQVDDLFGSIVFYIVCQFVLCGMDGFFLCIVLCFVFVVVWGNDGGQVIGDVVFILCFMVLCVFYGN